VLLVSMGMQRLIKSAFIHQATTVCPPCSSDSSLAVFRFHFHFTLSLLFIIANSSQPIECRRRHPGVSCEWIDLLFRDRKCAVGDRRCAQIISSREATQVDD
jgi:hypothetical protein